MNRYRTWILGFLTLTLLIGSTSCGETLSTVTPAPSTATPIPEATSTPVLPTLPPTETSTPAPPTGTPRPTQTPTPSPTPTPTISKRQRLLRSTVQIHALVEENDRFKPVWTGSGTIISPQGLILTNAHVVASFEENQQVDAIGVAVTARSDEPPPLQYLARVLFIDHQLDLAVIQIDTDVSGTPIDPEQLKLNHVALGDSDALELGDLLDILGYPGVGGETITFTEGVVSGFIRQRGIEGRAWIKTDTMIAPGNSGGLAADQHGQLVGVPTLMGENGFINALRPINLAQPLVEAARFNIGIEPDAVARGRGGKRSKVAGEPRFYRFAFSPGVNDYNQPIQIVSRIPTGSKEIYVFWDYENMLNGLAWEARWYYKDSHLADYAWPLSPWIGGEQGNWWVSFYNEAGLPDGTYRVELYVAGERLGEASVAVGDPAGGPALTNLTFSDQIATGGGAAEPTFLLPSGSDEIYVFFDYENMQADAAWRYVWMYQGETIAEQASTWDRGAAGSASVPLSTEVPLKPGIYRVLLFVEDDLVGFSGLTVAGTPSRPPLGPIAFATELDERGEAIDPATTLPAGIEELFYSCSYEGMQDGILVGERWLLNEEAIFATEYVWQEGEEGLHNGSLYTSMGNPLPDGIYTLELYVGGELVQSATVTIGSGTPPPTPTPPAEGLMILGYILDADTGRGIPGAVYIVLDPGVTLDSWDGSDAQIYTWAETDSNGYFELPLPLERGQQYSIIVGAEGYMPIGEDNVRVSKEPSPLEVEVYLQQQ